MPPPEPADEVTAEGPEGRPGVSRGHQDLRDRRDLQMDGYGVIQLRPIDGAWDDIIC